MYIIHRDIKDKNLPVTFTNKSKPKVKLIDFGLSALMQNGFYNNFGGKRTYALQSGHTNHNWFAL